MPCWWFAYTTLTKEVLLINGVDEDKISVLDNSMDTAKLKLTLDAVLESDIDQLAIRMERTKESQKSRNAFIDQYGNVDHYYVDHILEPMVLLKSEIDALNLVYAHPAFQSCGNIKNRLIKLTKGGICGIVF